MVDGTGYSVPFRIGGLGGPQAFGVLREDHDLRLRLPS